jgi:hypothetical protein
LKSKLNNISISSLGPSNRKPSFLKPTLGIIRLLPLLALLPALGPAVTISGSAACSMSGASSVTAPLSSETTAGCDLQGSNPTFQHADASVTAGSFSVSATANVAWSNIPPTYVNGSSSGKASVTEQYQVETSGPVRPGFLVLTPFVSTTPDLDDGHTAASVGVGNSTIVQSNQGSTAHCSPCEFPVTLGTIYDFGLSASVDSEASVIAQIPDDSGSASATLGFQFYDANGTPVSAEVIPEPGTLSLLGCALLAGLLRGLRRRENP